MTTTPGVLGKLRAAFRHRAVAWLVRTLAIASMSVAAAFGFSAAMRSGGARYDPLTLTVGASALFGVTCGAIGLLVARVNMLRAEVAAMRGRVEELADRNWELKEAEERTRSLIDAQGDVIVRHAAHDGGMDGERRITYANDAFCALASRDRGELVGGTFTLPVLEQGRARVRGRRHPHPRSADRDGIRRALDRLA